MKKKEQRRENKGRLEKEKKCKEGEWIRAER